MTTPLRDHNGLPIESAELPPDFSEVLNSDQRVAEIWTGKRRSLSNDIDLCYALRPYKYSFGERKAILLKFEHGARGFNGDRAKYVEEILRQSGYGAEGASKTAAKPSPSPFSRPINELLSKRLEEVDWVVRNLLAAGCNGWIGGEPKTYKTWLAILLWLCIALGTRFLDQFEVPRRRRVLFIEEEDSERRFIRRVRKLITAHKLEMPVDAGDYLRYSVRAGFRIDNKFWFESLEAEVKANKPEIVFVDVFNRIHARDENSQAEMLLVLERFEQLRRQFGAGFVILHHFRKAKLGDSRRGNQQLRGSSSLAGWAENSLYVRPGRKAGQIVIESEAKDGPQDSEFVVDISDTSNGGTVLRYAGSDQRAGQVDEMLRKVYEVLSSLGRPATATDIARGLGVSKNTARTHLTMLAETGQIHCLKTDKPFKYALSAQRENLAFEHQQVMDAE